MKAAWTQSMAERFLNLALFVRSGSYRTVRRYAKYRSRLPIAEKTVLFEAYHGARMSCVPYALFKAMLEDPDCADFTFVWCYNPHDDGGDQTHAAYKHLANVKFYPRHSAGYLKALASAKYLVNNKTFHHYFAKREGQIHLSSWHATAFKTLGKDQYGSMGQYGNVTRNYLQTDYLVMPNRLTSDVLLDSCDVRSLFPGRVVEAGYPRSDLTLNADQPALKRRLVDMLGIDPQKRIVLYAPTWRGEVGAAVDTTDVIVDNITDLAEGLPEGFQLLLKVHDRTYAFAKANPALSSLANVPDWFETNELLSVVDVLITDYSSICFDFLCLRRPIIHYVFDRAEYERTRGLYFDMETEMAGPLCYTADEVNGVIGNLDEVMAGYRERHEALIERLAYHEDGQASRRVLDIVLRGTQLEYSYRTQDAEKTRVLLYAGALSAKNAHLLDALRGVDFDTTELLLVFDGAPGKRDEYYLTRLDPRIKIHYRSMSPTRTFVTRSIERAAEYGYDSSYLSPAWAERCRDEFLGSVSFDVGVDLCGDASAWQLVFAHTEFKRTIVFLADPFEGMGLTFEPEFLARHFDVLACTSMSMLEYFSDTLTSPEARAKLAYCPPDPCIDAFISGLYADTAHLVGGIEHCLDSAAASLDPHCQSGDLLFEFRVGGLKPADLDAHPQLSDALAACDTQIRAAVSSVVEPCAGRRDGVTLVELLVEEGMRDA